MTGEEKDVKTTIKDKRNSGNFFVLQPNSSSLMTTVINEDTTQAVPNDKNKSDQNDKQKVPFTKNFVSINNDKKENSKENEDRKLISNTQNNTPFGNSLLNDEKEVDKKDKIDTKHDDDIKANSQDPNLVSRESKVIELGPKEEKLKENGQKNDGHACRHYGIKNENAQ